MSTPDITKQTYACHLDSLLDRFLQHTHITYPQVDQLGDDIYAKFSYLVASLPTGLTRNDTHIHTIMLKILNSITDWRRHSPLANHRLTSLWGWPGDDLTYEFDQISVDISFNFNRMNKAQWKIPAIQSIMQDESSSSEGSASDPDPYQDQHDHHDHQDHPLQDPVEPSTAPPELSARLSLRSCSASPEKPLFRKEPSKPLDQSPSHSQSESDEEDDDPKDSSSPRVSGDSSSESLPVQGMGISK